MKKNILIVDDDSSIRESLQKILASAGYEVTSAPDGESAESEFAKADVLILDLNLPIQDGWDILGHVSAHFPMLPVVVITGLVDQLDERTIPGASAFLEKPIEVPSLLTAVAHLLNQTPDERIKEFNRTSEPWQLSALYGRPVESPAKRGRRSSQRFRFVR